MNQKTYQIVCQSTSIPTGDSSGESITVVLEEDESFTIGSALPLKPLPVPEDYVPEGRKDTRTEAEYVLFNVGMLQRVAHVGQRQVHRLRTATVGSSQRVQSDDTNNSLRAHRH